MNESMYFQMPDMLAIREIKINRKVITTTLLNEGFLHTTKKRLSTITDIF